MSARDSSPTSEQSLPQEPPANLPETSEPSRAPIDSLACPKCGRILDIAKIRRDDGEEVDTLICRTCRYTVECHPEPYVPTPEPDPPAPPKFERPPLKTEEQAQAARAARKVQQLILNEQCRLTPAARYALLESVRDSAADSLQRTDQSIRAEIERQKQIAAKARETLAKVAPEKVPAPLTQEEL